MAFIAPLVLKELNKIVCKNMHELFASNADKFVNIVTTIIKDKFDSDGIKEKMEKIIMDQLDSKLSIAFDSIMPSDQISKIKEDMPDKVSNLITEALRNNLDELIKNAVNKQIIADVCAKSASGQGALPVAVITDKSSPVTPSPDNSSPDTPSPVTPSPKVKMDGGLRTVFKKKYSKRNYNKKTRKQNNRNYRASKRNKTA